MGCIQLKEYYYFNAVVKRRDGSVWLNIISRKDVALTVYLLDLGADPNLCLRNSFKTALWEAAFKNDYEMVKLLLDRGADLTLANAYVDTEAGCNEDGEHVRAAYPIDLARFHNNLDMVSLLENWEDRKLPGEESPLIKNQKLYYAAKIGNIEAVIALLDSGADYNVTYTGLKDNALSMAVRYNQCDVAELLLQRGAKLDHKTWWVWCSGILGHCLYKNYIDMVKIIINHKIPSDEEMSWALDTVVKQGNSEIVKLLLDNGADPNKLSQGGLSIVYSSTLANAVKMINYDVIEMLLRANANPNFCPPKNNDGGDKNQDTPLLIAVRKGSEDAVDLLLKYGALPNLANVEGDTPLIEAVKAERASIVNLLLSHGAVPDLANAKKETPVKVALKLCQQGPHEDILSLIKNALGPSELLHDLLEAIKNGRIEQAAKAIDVGADPNSVFEGEENALTAAVRISTEKPRVAMVHLLLDRGADPNLPNKSGSTALSVAIRARAVSVVGILFDKLADPNAAVENGGYTALTAAVQKCNEDYSSKSNAFGLGFDNWTAHQEMLTLLLDRGADPNRIDWSGNVPIVLAIQANNRKLVSLLANRGLNFNVTCKDGDTPLMMLVRKNDLETATLLLDHGADPNSVDGNGNTTLLLASRDAKVKMASLLMGRNANPNIANKEGKTALMASVCGNRSLTTVLLDHGADPNAVDQNGDTALLLAIKHKKTEMAILLISRNTDPNIANKEGETALMASARRDGTSLTNSLLDHGADPNAVDQAGNTALIYASINANKEKIRLLISRNANPDIANMNGDTALILLMKYVEVHKNGDTALIMAVRLSQTLRNSDYNLPDEVALVRLLLAKGANPNHINKHGESALVLAASKNNWMEVDNRCQLLPLLLSHGADANLMDHSGRTALWWSTYYKNRTRVSLLLQHGANPNLQGAESVIDLARLHGYKSILSLLEK